MSLSCLYASDYGPADPGFNPAADGGRLIKGFEAQLGQLSRATNLAQLEAMQRKIQRGEDITWCDQGYSWVYGRPVEALFGVIVIAVILPYAAIRARSWVRARRRGWTADSAATGLSEGSNSSRSLARAGK